ncbi:MAG: DUF434 domain-containing protein [Myxococcales bacterium]
MTDHGHPRHRGPHPEDRELFAAERVPVLREAVSNLSWLLGRGYSQTSALKVVGDRYSLKDRQRLAVLRAACSDASRALRAARRHALASLGGKALRVDGFNVLIAVEAALSGGVLFLGRDGALRDLSSIHGSYRHVEETQAALERIGERLAKAGPASVRWYLDRPVSNSGRLKASIEALAAAQGWPWTVEVVFNPDEELQRCGELVATTDAIILEGSVGWVPLSEEVVASVPGAWVVDLRAGG